MTPPVYNETTFRQQFPAFADTACFPSAAVQLAWNMGANWIDQSCSAPWGLGANTARWQQAADLMGAVILKQLGLSGGKGNQAPGPISAAAEGSVNVTFTIPELGSSALRALLLSNPPYGPLLLSLLQIAASTGAYVPSGRFARVPP